MRKFFSMLSVVGALATGLMTSNAEAFSPASVSEPHSEVVLVAGGCGVGFHRTVYGNCVPNVGVYGGVYRGGYRGGYHRGGYHRGGYHRGGGHRGGFHRGGGHRGGGRRR